MSAGHITGWVPPAWQLCNLSPGNTTRVLPLWYYRNSSKSPAHVQKYPLYPSLSQSWMHNQALRKGDAQFHTPHPSGKYTEENPRAFVLQPLSVWTALVNEVIHGNTWTLLRKPLLLWGLSLLQCDLHSALNCGIRLFTRLVIHKKDPKTPKINHRTSVIDCLRPVSSYWDPILSNFFSGLVWLAQAPLATISAFVLWPFVTSLSNREKNQTVSVQ